MFHYLKSAAFHGMDVFSIDVEVDVSPIQGDADKTTVVIVGLPDTAVKESKDRVFTAIKNAQGQLGSIRCIINLAPGDLKKEGPLYDLPIAMGTLLAAKKGPAEERLKDFLIVGELGLSGETRPIAGALGLAIFAREQGFKGLILPTANAAEAAAVPGVEIIPISHLRDAVKLLNHFDSIPRFQPENADLLFTSPSIEIDFADIKGHAHAKRALEIAAAGNHNVVFTGPPGSGKTLLAKALRGIMPPFTLQEALISTKIHSLAGLLPEGASLLKERPFRSPHHTVSNAGLIGGGNIPRPGEVALAHGGVLFLDEWPEFSRQSLEVLRQPLEDRKVTISRANGHYTYPTDFICIAAMNPCPCGFLGHPDKKCRDTEIQINKYRGKISGPLWDRMDLMIEVPALKFDQLSEAKRSEPSIVIRERVCKARQRQHKRFPNGKTNSRMTAREIQELMPFEPDCEPLLRSAVDNKGLSARSIERLKRVAVTIADLAEANTVTSDHLLEALSYRF